MFWVCKTIYLFTVTHCAYFLLPFTVIYSGTKGIADFHKLRITLLRKNINQNMNLTNEISGCILRVMMVFSCLFKKNFLLFRFFSWQATVLLTFKHSEVRCLEDLKIVLNLIIFWKKEKESWRKKEWESVFVSVFMKPIWEAEEDLLSGPWHAMHLEWIEKDVLQKGLHFQTSLLAGSCPVLLDCGKITHPV